MIEMNSHMWQRLRQCETEKTWWDDDVYCWWLGVVWWLGFVSGKGGRIRMRLYWEVLIGSKIVQKYLRFHICDIILDDIMRVRLCSVRPYDIIFSKSHLNKISHIFSRLFISANILELEPRRCLSPVRKSPSLSNYFILKISVLDFHQNWKGGWSINVAENISGNLSEFYAFTKFYFVSS